MNGQITSTAPFKSSLVEKIIQAKKALTTVPPVEVVMQNVREVTKCANTAKKGDCTSCSMAVCPAIALANKFANH